LIDLQAIRGLQKCSASSLRSGRTPGNQKIPKGGEEDSYFVEGHMEKCMGDVVRAVACGLAASAQQRLPADARFVADAMLDWMTTESFDENQFSASGMA